MKDSKNVLTDSKQRRSREVFGKILLAMFFLERVEQQPVSRAIVCQKCDGNMEQFTKDGLLYGPVA